ncbi:LPS translocon maturation chaperone LptM [Methylocapsa palsarum]|uniref:LPS translocon maturation chaperone LptM n=1 Tax=Methylocapsa palsarum TaxID=1612308 RepID=UPI00111435BF|nr:lipoprotein [Methylocapsa palsarum]
MPLLPCFSRPLRLALTAAIFLAVGGCGRRGPLEPPPGSPTSLAPLSGAPDQYAAPRSVADLPGENAAGAVVTQGAAPGQTPPQPKGDNPVPVQAPRPPRPFLLDPLL